MKTNEGMKPSHLGQFIRRQVLEALDLNISRAAEVLGAPRATLSDLLNGKTALSPKMALRLEKVFDIKMDFMLRMQALYDGYRMRQAENEIDLAPFQQ